MVAKLFTPSVRCPNCSYTNDSDYRFCQRCGSKRKILNNKGSTPFDVDVNAIDDRRRQLALFDQATCYSRQKASLQRESENSLSSLPDSITVSTVTPRDICRFLVHKDKNEKTQVHCNGCPHLGKRGTFDCACPLRLSYKTVDSYIGKLEAIFRAIGRDGEWDGRLGLGNPAEDQSVKDYLRLVTAERLQARVTPKQAFPFFVDKLVAQLSDYNITPTHRLVLARDQEHFKAVFFSGDRPGDMGLVKVPEILRFPNDDGFLFNHVWRKPMRDGHNNVFGIKRNPQTKICPVQGIEHYTAVAQLLRINLRRGYLFRPATPQGGILDAPFSSTAAGARLKGYLKEMGSDDGETIHNTQNRSAKPEH